MAEPIDELTFASLEGQFREILISSNWQKELYCRIYPTHPSSNSYVLRNDDGQEDMLFDFTRKGLRDAIKKFNEAA